MRVAAVVQAVVLALLALVVLDAAGFLALGWTASLPWLVWVPVVFSALSVLVNAISPSPLERRLWAPGRARAARRAAGRRTHGLSRPTARC